MVVHCKGHVCTSVWSGPWKCPLRYWDQFGDEQRVYTAFLAGWSAVWPCPAPEQTHIKPAQSSLHCPTAVVQTCNECSGLVVLGPLLMCSSNQPTEGTPCTKENMNFPCIFFCFLPCFQCHATRSCSFLLLYY